MKNHYIYKRHLWFLYAALFYSVIYLCVKFEITSFYTLEVMPETKNPTLKFTKGKNSKK